MKILQVSMSDIGGGAERVAWNLHASCRARGHDAWLAVGRRQSNDPNVLEIPKWAYAPPAAPILKAVSRWLTPLAARVPGVRRLRNGLLTLSQGWPEIERRLGREAFHAPGTRELLKLPPSRPEIVHAHNLHGSYFDLRLLPALSREVPVVLTLHDEWLLTGHCAYAFDCGLWETGCGHCPDLTIYPAIARDGTSANWRIKRAIYRRARLHVATPSRWLLDEVRRSMLHPLETRVIPNGIDLNTYSPGDAAEARAALGIAPEALVLLFVAVRAKTNRFKDYPTIARAMAQLKSRAPDRPVQLIVLGSEAREERIGQAQVRFLPFDPDPAHTTRWYRAADVVLHAARTDNFPNTVLEAQACGRPVVATAVGGVPEQIVEGRTGFLTPPGDAAAMAARIQQLLDDPELRRQMGAAALDHARHNFGLEAQADAYLHWYEEILKAGGS